MEDIFSSVNACKEWRTRNSGDDTDALSSKVIERIRLINERINAFCHLDGAFTGSMSASGDTSREGALSGVPIAVKSNICIKGALTSCASAMLRDYRPPYSATVIEKLLDEGAMIVGGANMDEFAFGSSCETSFFGPTRNPWDTSRIPGGSSGGCAAAVASGAVPLAIGSDTGGSIRQPAAMCGVVGLKPTYGRVSRSGLVAFASSLDQIGPFARDVRDCALLLEVLAGHDPRDPTSVDMDVPSYSSALTGRIEGSKIGVPRGFFEEGIDEDVRSRVEEAIEVYEGLGADVVEIELPHARYAVSCYCIIASAEASSNMSRYDGVHYGHRSANAKDLNEVYTFSRSETLGAEAKRRILLGTFALSSGYYEAYYRKAQKVRTLIAEDFREAFTQCDIVLTPTSPGTAFALGERLASPLAMYLSDVFTVPVNLAGLPALSVPCGLDRRSLPVGLQLIAPPFEEGRLLNTAYAFESNTERHATVAPLLKEVTWS